MGQHPITMANIALILLGVILVGSGPLIIYRTVRGLKRIRQEDPECSIHDLHPISNGLNLVIAVLLSWAGVLFIINNLRGSYFS